MAKHFTIDITDEAFTFTGNHQDIAAEVALDGIYVLRTSLPTDALPTKTSCCDTSSCGCCPTTSAGTRSRLAPILFVDNDKPATAAKSPKPVAPALGSDEALTKAAPIPLTASPEDTYMKLIDEAVEYRAVSQ